MKRMNEPMKTLYLVRVFNDKCLPDRFYDEYFFTECEQDEFYKKITAYGFEAVKRKEEIK